MIKEKKNRSCPLGVVGILLWFDQRDFLHI